MYNVDYPAAHNVILNHRRFIVCSNISHILSSHLLYCVHPSCGSKIGFSIVAFTSEPNHFFVAGFILKGNTLPLSIRSIVLLLGPHTPIELLFKLCYLHLVFYIVFPTPHWSRRRSVAHLPHLASLRALISTPDTRSPMTFPHPSLPLIRSFRYTIPNPVYHQLITHIKVSLPNHQNVFYILQSIPLQSLHSGVSGPHCT